MRRTNSDDDDDNNAGGGGVGLCVTAAAMENDDDEEATRKHPQDCNSSSSSTRNRSRATTVSLCKYMAADRWCLQGAFVSSQWLVCTCLNCERPYVRDFTVPETLRRVCKQCRKSVSTTQRKCEVCMKQFRCSSKLASSFGAGGRAPLPHLVYDDYSERHRFRLIDTCASCHTKLANMRRYEHLSLGACVAAAHASWRVAASKALKLLSTLSLSFFFTLSLS